MPSDPQFAQWGDLFSLAYESAEDATLTHYVGKRRARTPVAEHVLQYEQDLADQEAEEAENGEGGDAGGAADVLPPPTPDEVAEAICRNLDIFLEYRSWFQTELHSAMLAACARTIWGPELDTRQEEIMRRFGWDNLKQQVLAISPRREGKTTAVAGFAASALVSIPRCSICVFSTCRAASRNVLQKILFLLKRVEGIEATFTYCNSETLWIRGPHGRDDIRKVMCLSSSKRVCHFCFSSSVCCLSLSPAGRQPPRVYKRPVLLLLQYSPPSGFLPLSSWYPWLISGAVSGTDWNSAASSTSAGWAVTRLACFARRFASPSICTM